MLVFVRFRVLSLVWSCVVLCVLICFLISLVLCFLVGLSYLILSCLVFTFVALPCLLFTSLSFVLSRLTSQSVQSPSNHTRHVSHRRCCDAFVGTCRFGRILPVREVFGDARPGKGIPFPNPYPYPPTLLNLTPYPLNLLLEKAYSYRVDQILLLSLQSVMSEELFEEESRPVSDSFVSDLVQPQP
jgi:hypothetical protein